MLNKCDLAPEVLDHPVIGANVRVSAITGYGIEALLDAIAKAPAGFQKESYTACAVSSRGEILHEIRQNGEVLSQAYTDGGIKIEAFADAAYLNKIKEYIL